MEEDSRIDMSILLQFAKFSKGFKVTDFDKFIQESIGVENINFFGRLAYPNQWQLRLTNPEIRERLIRTGRTRINNRSCWMYPLNQQEIRGFIHWLPNSVNNDHLMEYLKLYGDVLFVESQEQIIKGQRVESDLRYYGLILPYGTIKEDLPHFLKINGFLCLVVVRGREPACFHCKEIGHRRIECPKYKTKLIDYCRRDPNTAVPRLKPRGRRHIQVESKIKDEVEGKYASSSDDVLDLEKEVQLDEKITETPLLSEQECIIEVKEDGTSSTGDELLELGDLTKTRATSCLNSSAASLSETRSILEALQQIQRRTSKDLHQRLKNFEKEVTQVFTREKLSIRTKEEKQNPATDTTDNSIHLGQEISNKELEKQTNMTSAFENSSTSVEIAEEDYDETHMEETKEEVMPTELLTKQPDILEATRKVSKKASETAMDSKSTGPTEVYLASATDPRSILITLEQTKQTAAEILEDTFKRLAGFATSKELVQKLPTDSAIDTDQTLIRNEKQFYLLKLEQAKEIAAEHYRNTFKRLDEEIANLSFQLTDVETEKDTRLTEDDIQFARQMLEQTKESVKETLQSTFAKLEKEIAKETKPTRMISQNSAESKLPLKIAAISTESLVTSEQLKEDVFDTVKYQEKEEMEIVEAENIEKQSVADNFQENPTQIECDPTCKDTGVFQSDKTLDHFKACEKGTSTETPVTARKNLELHVSKTTLKGIDKLQTNISEIFASVFENDKSELLRETKSILEQVELKVHQVVEEMKNGLK